MKRIFVIIATLALVFMSCDSGDIIGGRYFGTFHNTNNNMLEAGGLSFTYNNNGDGVYFQMNDLMSMMQAGKCQFTGVAEGALLNDLLKTMPAIDSIQVCDSTEAITNMAVEAEFKGNSVKTKLVFTTNTDKTVNVDFIGCYE
jgi:hypothetical protein